MRPSALSSFFVASLLLAVPARRRHRLRHRARCRPRSAAPPHCRRAGHAPRRGNPHSSCTPPQTPMVNSNCLRSPSVSTSSKSPPPASPPSLNPSHSPPAPILSSTFLCRSPSHSQSVVVAGPDSECLATDSVTPTTLITRARDRRNTRRQPHARHADDHRLRARRLHDPRHAAHARRPSDQLAHRWHRHSQHQDRLQRRPADRPQRHRSARNAARQLRRRHRRPHLRRLQRAAAQWIRAQSRSANFCSPAATSTPAKLNSRSAITPPAPPGTRASPVRAPTTAWPHRLPPSITTPPTRKADFVSLIRNQTAEDQLRLDAQYRQDFFQIPYDPDPRRLGAASDYYSSYGLRDAQTERDSFVIANWVHTLSPKALFGCALLSLQPGQLRLARQPTFRWPPRGTRPRTTPARRRMLAPTSAPTISPPAFTRFYQAENDLFGLVINDELCAAACPTRRPTKTPDSSNSTSPTTCASVDTSRCLAAMRISIYHGGLTETATYPRIGATVEIPRLHWVLRGFYGHFFQPAPV